MLKKTKSFLFLYAVAFIGSVLINKIFEIRNFQFIFYVFALFDLVIFFLYATDYSADTSLEKAWEKVSTTFFMVVTYLLVRLFFGYLLNLPLSATFQYFLSLELLSGKFALTQTAQAFLLDIGLLIVICGTWAKFPCDPKKMQRLTMSCGTALAIFAIVIAVISKLSPLALERILGWGPQLNELIGYSLPETLTSWSLLAIIGAGVMIWWGIKSKQLGGIIVLIVLIAAVVFAARVALDALKPSSSNRDKGVFLVPDEKIGIAKDGIEIYRIGIPSGEFVETGKFSAKGYARVEIENGEGAILVGFEGEGSSKRWKIAKEFPFETRHAPAGKQIYIWGNPDKNIRVLIKVK